MVLGAAVWFYFLTPSSKAQAYAPTILTGSAISATFVMALTFVADLIGDNKVYCMDISSTFCAFRFEKGNSLDTLHS